jgi:hypothetical protein
MHEFEKLLKDVLAGVALMLLAIVAVFAIVALWPQLKPPRQLSVPRPRHSSAAGSTQVTRPDHHAGEERPQAAPLRLPQAARDR